MKDKLIYSNGVNALTGHYLLSPLSSAEFLKLTKGAKVHGGVATWFNRIKTVLTRPFLGLPYDVDPKKISEAGWAIVFPSDAKAELRNAMEPLILHRRKYVPPDRMKILDYHHGETALDWLKRLGSAAGNVNPRKVPYYVLLIGNPTEIPFEFQYHLDVEYAVGRLGFDHLHQYQKYTESIVSYETTDAVANAREAVVWGTHHINDGFTDMSTAYLTTPLCNGEDGEPAIGKNQIFSLSCLTELQATKANLLNVLRGRKNRKTPAILFTASHGMGWSKEDSKGQKECQGALLCQDWTGIGSIDASHFLKASEIPDDANVKGMVVLTVACYGAGIPEFDAFLRDRAQGPSAIADEPFISALPQRLLSHPNGGALAVIGHIERIWTLSFVPPGLPSQLIPFRNFFGRVMSGEPIGHAMTDFNQRYAVLAAELLANQDNTKSDAHIEDTEEMVWKWIECADAQNFVVLGDPAAHVRVNDLR
jgi:hypothetical protein